MSYKCNICHDIESNDEDSEIEYPSDLTSESEYEHEDHHSNDDNVSDGEAHSDYDDRDSDDRQNFSDNGTPSDDENSLRDTSEESEDESDNEKDETSPAESRPKRLRSSRHKRDVNAPVPAGVGAVPAGRGHYKKQRRTYVKFPTGKMFAITLPKPNSWRCGQKTRFITLHRRGRMGRREYTIVAKEMVKTIRKHIRCAQGGGCLKSYRIMKIQKVVNGCLWKRYRARVADVASEAGFTNQRFLFHGTTAANIRDICRSGFDERHAHLNGMFGAGIYFAKHSSKCNQYAYGYMGGKGCPKHRNKSCRSCPRKMLLCRVILGRQKRYFKEHILAHPPVGYHSVLGVPSKKGLWFPEYVVYRGEQVYPEYLITYTIV